MKIVLIEHPREIIPERCNDIANTPLSSCLISGYAAGMLRHHGHEVQIIEGYLDGLTYEEITERVALAKPAIIGIHMVYHWNRDEKLYSFLGMLKDKGLAPYITAYGFYATVAMKRILAACSPLDSIIPGEPEAVFCRLTSALTSGTYDIKIPGLAARDETGAMSYEPADPPSDLDALPFPVRTAALYRLPEVNLLGSRGCYGRCTFCYINTFFGNKMPWRGRSPENIASEIDEIISKSGNRDFYFTDPNFFGPGRAGQERALKIASLLKERKIRFGIEARVNDIHDETIAALVNAGLRHILIGLESGKDESLRRMNKMTTVAQNEEALRILRRHGIEPNVGFIMFEPDSSVQDIRCNFDFLRRNDLLKDLSITANLLYHHQIVLEGTAAFDMLRRDGRLNLEGSDYEGSAQLENYGVAVLSNIMRRVTNTIFQGMEGIWSGRFMEPPGMQKKYAEVNRLLVELFESSLSMIEGGEVPGQEEQDLLVLNAEKTIESLIGRAN